jgi:Fe-S-cluster containining protein
MLIIINILTNTVASMIDARDLAITLLKATALPDEAIFSDLSAPKYTSIDYYRMACHIIFECKRCGNCCTTGDPIRLAQEDIARIAKHLKMPLNKAIKKLTVPDPSRPHVRNFKHILPCKFYDPEMKICKLYNARPWSCRIFPFLGIYGSEDRIKIHESCPGSVEAMNVMIAALEKARSLVTAPSLDEVRQAKERLRAALERI